MGIYEDSMNAWAEELALDEAVDYERDRAGIVKIKAREIKPLDILITRTFLHGEERTPVHLTHANFRDSTKVNVVGFDGESFILDADMSVDVIRGGALDNTTRPTKPGQAVRSGLDGTLGVTISHVGKSDYLTGNYIDVMFLGSVAPGPFDCYDLTVVDVEEVKP